MPRTAPIAHPDYITAFSHVDWQHYLRSRPPWPASLRALIYDYRFARTEAPQWTSVVDIGPGIGVSSIPFVRDFDVVHLSDPSPHNLVHAWSFLSQWIQHHGLQARLEVSQCRAENAWQHVEREMADLVICAGAAHFIDPAALIVSAAYMLRPGGTLALYSYWSPVFPGRSEALTDAFNTAVARSFALGIGEDDDNAFARDMFTKIGARMTAGRAMLDSVPISDKYFHDVQRVRINPDAHRAVEIFREAFPLPIEPLPSGVGPHDKETCYVTGRHGEADGWSFIVDNEWLHNFCDSLRPPGKLTPAQYEAIYGEWDRLFAEECPVGAVKTVWPVSLVLATRKPRDNGRAPPSERPYCTCHGSGTSFKY